MDEGMHPTNDLLCRFLQSKLPLKREVGKVTTSRVVDMLPLVHFFEKLVEWLGLSRNSGSLLAVLYAERYATGERLSLEELAEATSYSRSNVTLILSQLEAAGIVEGETDLNQTGRGRRRILYRIRKEIPSPVFLMIRTMEDRLHDSLDDLDVIKKTLSEDGPSIRRMLDDFGREIRSAIELLSRPPASSLKR